LGENDHASFIVDEQDGVGERLDVWSSEKLGLSRSQTKGYIDQGFIVVNNEHVKAGFKLRQNDTCQVSIPAPKPLGILAESIPLNIVYEDEDLIVVNKQKGLVVHPAAGNWNGTLVNALLEHCHDLSGIGGTLRPGIVHRLDKDTSGLMVVAKNDRAHRHLAEQIKMRAVKRHYLALVYGNPPEEKGTIEAPLGRHPVHRKKMGIVDDGRYAVQGNVHDSNWWFCSFNFPYFTCQSLGKRYSTGVNTN